MFYINLYKDIPEPDRTALKALAYRLTVNLETVPDILEIINDISDFYDSFGITETIKAYTETFEF